MSIKRTKQSSSYGSRARDVSDDENNPFGNKVIEPVKTWAEQTEGKADDAFAPYAMSTKFEKGALIAHPKFGRGAVVAVEGARIEVLFEDGPKKLGHAG